ncbi:hypothetical protein BGZ67_006011 [Mortierella alpina]|nr:hypothetical protein BGZ67_006011 [Mortierella alpina]
MVKLITRTLTKSPKKGVPILNEWHYENPADPCQENLPVDAFQRRKDTIVNLMVDEALRCTKCQSMTIQSLTVTDSSETLIEEDVQEFAPPQIFSTLGLLQHLGLESIQPHKINWFLRPTSCFPCLQSLVLTYTALDREGALLLWKIFPILEVLSLMDVQFLDTSAVRENMTSMICPRLKKLYLHYNNGGFPMEDQYQLLLSCPSLVAFHWVLPNGNERHLFTSRFMEIHQTYNPERVREVEELHIVGEMDDYGTALAMNNMPGIRSLSISIGNQIGILSLSAMNNLAANLTRFEPIVPSRPAPRSRLSCLTVLYSTPW